jgi:2-dehydropantoate 2-reductase
VRWVVYGLGAIGGVVASELHRAGFAVVAVARGRQLDIVRREGLRLETPDGVFVVPLDVAADASELRLGNDDVVLLTVKSQDSAAAVHDLVRHGPADAPAIVCLQNGVENEPCALRWFPRVYGACVLCPAAYLDPGVVIAYSSPKRGIIDVGRFPHGSDEEARAFVEAFGRARFDSQVLDDVQRSKYGKLLMNLTNAIDAVCGPEAREGPIAALARAEAERCLSEAGIDHARTDEDRKRQAQTVTPLPVSGRDRHGASSWQSLTRATGSIETDYLNGEIVLLGRLHGVPTPVNALLQRLANELAWSHRPPGSVTEEEVLSLISTDPAATGN